MDGTHPRPALPRAGPSLTGMPQECPRQTSCTLLLKACSAAQRWSFRCRDHGTDFLLLFPRCRPARAPGGSRQSSADKRHMNKELSLGGASRSAQYPAHTWKSQCLKGTNKYLWNKWMNWYWLGQLCDKWKTQAVISLAPNPCRKWLMNPRWGFSRATEDLWRWWRPAPIQQG